MSASRLLRYCGLAAALTGVSWCESARADAVGTFGLGSRSTSLGGAVAADATDFSATYYNPSGLVRDPAFELTLGYEHATPKLGLNNQPDEIEDSSAFTGGLRVPGSLAGIPVAFGLAAHLPRRHLSRVMTLRPDEPHYIFFDNRPQQLHLSLGIAARPAPWLTVGAGLGFLAATRGGFAIGGSAVQPVSGRSEYDSQLTHEIDAELQSVRYPILGVTVLPSATTAVALVYRGQARAQLDLEATLQGTLDYTLLQLPAYYQVLAATVSSFIPQQAVLGVSHQLLADLRLNFDLSWIDWSAFQSAQSISSSTLQVDVPATLPLDVPMTAAPSTRADPRFSDTVVPRVAVEYSAIRRSTWQIPLRAGYSFQTSPIPESQPNSVFLDFDRHVVSVGLGLVLPQQTAVFVGDVRIDAGGFLMLPVDRVVAGANQSVTTGGVVFGAGLNASVRLW